MSGKKQSVTEAGFPSVSGPHFLFSTTLNAHQAQSLEQAVIDGHMTRCFTAPMIGAALTPYGIGAMCSPIIASTPVLETVYVAGSGLIPTGLGQFLLRWAAQYNALPKVGKGLNIVNKAISHLNQPPENWPNYNSMMPEQPQLSHNRKTHLIP